MVYGNLVFIKKTGGDGSKFPVTKRDIKIGRSEDCLIRIYNPQVEPEHCQLIIGDNGLTTLRNLSKQTILNGKPLAQGDVILSHGDVFKLGERSVRWEYLPPTKNPKQLLSPSGRLVAVVMPQQISLDDHVTPKSSSQTSSFRNTPLGKRSYSERGASESSPTIKVSKASGKSAVRNSHGAMTGRHSQPSQSLLWEGKGKLRKSVPGVAINGISECGKLINIIYCTPGKSGEKSRKSTVSSWKVKIRSSPEQKSERSKKSPTKSSKKSVKSPKSAVKTPSVIELKPSQELLSSASNSELKTPQKVTVASELSEVLVKSNSKVKKTPLWSNKKSPSRKSEASVRSTRSFSKSPSPRKSPSKSPSKVVASTPKPKPFKLERLTQSESKVKSNSERRSALPKGSKRMSLILGKLNSSGRQGLVQKSRKSLPHKKVKLSEEVSHHTESQTNLLKSELSSVQETQARKSVKGTPARKSPGKTPKKSLLRKSVKTSAGVKLKTPRKSVVIRTPGSLKKKRSTPGRSSLKEVAPSATAETSPLVDPEDAPSPKRAKLIPRNSVTIIPTLTSAKKTPRKSVKSAGRGKSPASARKVSPFRRNEAETAASSPKDISAVKPVPKSPSPTRKSSAKDSPAGQASGVTSPRGIRRKLSPSSSAERAAKMLKTSSPKKPDKNKKAALLVLGKASRKQLLSQNMKVLLKQKIVKKAIKQSTAGTSQKVEVTKKLAPKVMKVVRKKGLTAGKKSAKKKKPVVRSSPAKASTASDASVIKSPVKDKVQEATPKGKIVVETKQTSPSKTQSSERLSVKGKIAESPAKSPSKQNKKSESPRSIVSPRNFISDVMSSPVQNYMFLSNRRSKRLSSKNDTDRPDFIELSPTALGLMPKNVTIFKTPKDTKRRSSSLVTPKSIRTTGIIKSASTSKIGNRKNVRFSSKDVSYNADFHTPDASERAELDFSSYNTPDVTVDTFVSPLTEKSTTKKDLNASKVATGTGSKSKSPKSCRMSSEPRKCVRKLLQSPKGVPKSVEKVSSVQKPLSRDSKSSASKSPSPTKPTKDVNENKSPRNVNDAEGIRQLFPSPKAQKSPKNRLSDLKGVRRLMRTPKGSKSPKNDLTDVKGVKKLFQTPKMQKSPKNDLTDVRGVKKLLKTPKVQKSPRNDLTDVKGVKKLLQTPVIQKSPKNDLTDVRGVRKLMQTPKAQKRPKNDLTDVRGVKKLMRTPKVQKSPKNDLRDVRGVKKLMRTPKAQKSPKNDLTNVDGVKQLLGSPRVQKSPKNDLSDLRGVKKLLGSPKVQKSPKNDLSDLRGVKKLLGSPKVQKSPKNDLSDLRGVKKLLGSPRVQKSPKNDLTDVAGVKKLLTTPRAQKSPKNNLLDVSGVQSLFTSPAVEKLPRSSTAAMKMLASSPESGVSLSKNAVNVTGVKQLLISKSPESVSKSTKNVSRKSHVKDYRAIRGRRTIYATPKGPKNDLSDVTGVRELFSRHKPISDYNINLTGVAELFDLPNVAVGSNQKKEKPGRKSTAAAVRKTPAKRTVTDKPEIVNENVEETVTRRGRSKRATETVVQKASGSKVTKSTEVKKPSKRKAVEKIKTGQVKKSSVVAKKSEKSTKKETSGKKTQAKTKTEPSEVTGSRKRKVQFEEVETPPPKLARRQPAAKKSKSSVAAATASRSTSRSRKEAVSEQKVSPKSLRKGAAKDNKTSKVIKKVQPKTVIKTGTKQTQKVQNRSQSSSETESADRKGKQVSPRKTRSGKSVAASKATQKKVSKTKSTKVVGKKTAEDTVGRSKVSPAAKRSTRRK